MCRISTIRAMSLFVQQFPRPAFQITISHAGREIDIVTAHMKSKLLTFGSSFSTTNETLRAHSAYFALERRAAEATKWNAWHQMSLNCQLVTILRIGWL